MVSLCPETAKSLAAEILRADIFVAIKKVCPFCVKLLDTLQRMELIGNANVISETHPLFVDVRKAVQEAYQFKTVPVVFIRGRFVGGNSDFMEIKHKVKDLMELPKLDSELLFTDTGRIQPFGLFFTSLLVYALYKPFGLFFNKPRMNKLKPVMLRMYRGYNK